MNIKKDSSEALESLKYLIRNNYNKYNVVLATCINVNNIALMNTPNQIFPVLKYDFLTIHAEIASVGTSAQTRIILSANVGYFAVPVTKSIP